MRIIVSLLVLLLALSSTAFAQQPMPKIDSVQLVRLASPPGTIQVIVRGRGMVGEWAVKGAMVGKAQLSGVVVYPRGEGFVGLLASEPPDGSDILVKGADDVHFNAGRFSIDAVKGAPRSALDKREDCSFPVVPGKSIGPVKLGMTIAELGKLKATIHPQNSVWYELGPITAKVDKGKVDLMWISRPTMCLVDGGKQIKLDLPRPKTASPSPFPFPDCPWPTEKMIGGACFQCTARGMQVCHGASGWFPEVKVQPAKP